MVLDKKARLDRRAALRRRYFPEIMVDGYSRLDKGVEFYTRVNALVNDDSTVVDFGAGRGQWFVEPSSAVHTNLRDFRRRAKRVIGVDVDPAVKKNQSLDEAHLIREDGSVPLPDGSADVVVSDFTFEHIEDPAAVCREMERILAPGGWICARTPNKWGYIGVAARLVPNGRHVQFLSRLQPHRHDVDVFPVCYKLNTARSVSRHFPPDRFKTVTYTLPAEPAYTGGSRLLWHGYMLFQRLQPRALDPIFVVFAQKTDG